MSIFKSPYCSHGYQGPSECPACKKAKYTALSGTIHTKPTEVPYSYIDHVFTPWQKDPEICGLCGKKHGNLPPKAVEDVESFRAENTRLREMLGDILSLAWGDPEKLQQKIEKSLHPEVGTPQSDQPLKSREAILKVLWDTFSDGSDFHAQSLKHQVPFLEACDKIMIIKGAFEWDP